MVYAYKGMEPGRESQTMMVQGRVESAPARWDEAYVTSCGQCTVTSSPIFVSPPPLSPCAIVDPISFIEFVTEI